MDVVSSASGGNVSLASLSSLQSSAAAPATIELQRDAKQRRRLPRGAAPAILFSLLPLVAGIPTAAQAQEAPLEVVRVVAGGTPLTVPLARTYTSPVVVCSATYAANTTPVVVRVSQATSSSFALRLQNPSDGPVAAETVSCLVVEQGVWTVSGVKFEAQKYTSTVTDSDASWMGQTRSYGQSYTSPVVLGQVMTENDPDWSVFWSRGFSRSDPPSATSLRTGKTVGEDPDTTRANETIGIVVFEAGHGFLAGQEYEARLGPNTVQGAVNGAPFAYTFASAFASAPAAAVVSIAGVNGPNGAWGQTHGAFRQVFGSMFMPEGTAEHFRYFDDLQRATSSPENAEKIFRVSQSIDVAALCQRVRVPTLVLHARNEIVIPFSQARLMASTIPGAKLVPLDSRNHLIFEHEPAWQKFLDEVESFVRSEGAPG